MSAQPLSLGPFDLLEPIGAGGMAEVWQATHRVQRIPVAVKVITRGQAREPQILTAFRNEVRAVAGLDHPHVVLLLDTGEVTLEAEAASQGRLIAGSPYLVMELATEGTLAGREGPLPWPTLRRILLTLLDALAHAHARGVVHLDLKPQNVLVSGAGDLRPGLKLTDFGIAHAIDHRRQSGTAWGVLAERAFIGGTPFYMAPEQVRGEWREFGPWTDLYSLGCLGYELASGSSPFLGDTPLKVCAAHCLDAPPALRPRAPVPAGFASWLLRLLEKNPDRRFRRAADAAWSLMQLEEIEGSPELEPAGWLTLSRPPPALAALLGSAGFAATPVLSRSAIIPQTIPSVLAAMEARRIREPHSLETREFSPAPSSAASVTAESTPSYETLYQVVIPSLLDTSTPDRPDLSSETLPPGGAEYYLETLVSGVAASSHPSAATDGPTPPGDALAEMRAGIKLEPRPLASTLLMAPPDHEPGGKTWVTLPADLPTALPRALADGPADPESAGPSGELPEGLPEITEANRVRALTDATDQHREMRAAATSFLQLAPPASVSFPGLIVGSSAPLETIPQPPLPRDWRDQGPPERPLPLIGAGLGLYPLRTIPLVDRLRERDVIWNALREARESGAARLVLVRGASGHGKSRLVEWMGERADELGAAIILKAFHSPSGGMTDGLPAMLVRHLRCTGLNRTEALARVTGLLQRQGVTDDYEWHALTELMTPALAPPPPSTSTPQSGRKQKREEGRIHFGSLTERFVVLQRLLERLGLERQVIVWFDDVQWGSEALSLIEHLLKAQRLFSSPILLLATVQNEALADRPLETSQIDRLALMEDVTVLTVPPLPPEDHQALVQQLLHLEGALAAKVEARAGGNPLFAVQLVGDWVQRGVLEVGRTGFVLKPGEQAILPDDIHALWMAQVTRLLDRKSDAPQEPDPAGSSPAQDALAAFELAAILGRRVDEAEWRQACLEASIEFPRALLDSPATHRLLQPVRDTTDGASPPAWLFLHGMLRESLERSARESGRWSRLNLACVRMLERLYPVGIRGLDERMGRHALAAGTLELALAPLGRAAQRRWEQGEFPEATDLLDLRADVMKRLGLPESDSRWGEDQVLRATSYHRQGELDLGLQTAREAEAAARKYGWSDLQGKALVALGVSLRWQGELIEAETMLRKALELYESRGDLRGAAEGWKSLAALEWELGHAERGQRSYLESLRFARLAGDPHSEVGSLLGLAQLAWTHQAIERARTLMDESMVLAEQTGNQFAAAETLRMKGQVAMRSDGDLAQANEIFRQAMMIYTRIGVQFGVSFCLNELAEAARLNGDLDAAEADYRRSLEIVEALRPGTGYLQRYNLALTLLERANFPEARRLLETCRAEIESSSRLRYLGSVYAALLVCVAAAQDWPAWDAHFRSVLDLLGNNDEIDADDAGLLERAGSLARDAGELERAGAAWQMAARMWRALKQEEKAVEVEGRC